MKYVVIVAVAFLTTAAAAGEIVPIANDDGLTAQASVEALEGAAATGLGLSADASALGLQGSASAVPLTGLSTAEGLDGQGQGTGLMGFVDVPLPPSPPEPLLLPVPEPTRFELVDLHFEYNSAELAQTESAVIAELAAIITRTAPKRRSPNGHTDRRGDSDYNLALS